MERRNVHNWCFIGTSERSQWLVSCRRKGVPTEGQSYRCTSTRMGGKRSAQPSVIIVCAQPREHSRRSRRADDERCFLLVWTSLEARLLLSSSPAHPAFLLSKVDGTERLHTRVYTTPYYSHRCCLRSTGSDSELPVSTSMVYNHWGSRSSETACAKSPGQSAGGGGNSRVLAAR